ncbi:nucleoside triphosphate pyrophosphohydrolase [Desnuesiella massiliensis]|uniref:nucleoside triphosphate pyrophosphohydrolase n=1 Tax=Desnuesiella massiliensis TaxID=1650662 RepID=UPI0006E3541E|nr:nucleoside triphosphate pyrophosphohydrolase [Desnuesiella massiliensis]
MIKILGLGPGSKEALTTGTLEALKGNSNIFFRTEKHPTVEYLKAIGINYTTYDYAYDKFDNFDEVYNFIALDLISRCEELKEVIYAVPGHPFVAEKSVRNIINLCKAKGIEYKIYPAVSFIDAMMEALDIDPVEGLKIIDAFDMENHILDKRIGTVITQVYDNFIASEVKIRLSEYYRDDTEVYYVRAAGIEAMESIRKIPLYEIDRQEDIDYLTSIYIPKDLDNNRDFNDLLDIMDTLRGENGCPWDREQTHESLKKYLIEECYEVIEAIDEQEDNKIIEELGDVLLQIVFHAAIAKEEGFFNIMDITKAICDKMILRHPHVFGEKTVKNSEEVLENWDNIKKKEKGIESLTEEMRSIAKSLPAMLRAEKIQNKAKKVGFDWDNVEDAMNKILEEFNEVKDVYKGENKAKILEEIGDLLFACVNVARFLNISPEEALNSTNEKFISRFNYIEEFAKKSGKDLCRMTLEEMDEIWNISKKTEKS